jgi:hypothetical protein
MSADLKPWALAQGVVHLIILFTISYEGNPFSGSVPGGVTFCRNEEIRI